MPRRARSDIKVAVVYDGPVPAPIRKGDVVAKLVYVRPAFGPGDAAGRGRRHRAAGTDRESVRRAWAA